jgi:RES domain-containing protein
MQVFRVADRRFPLFDGTGARIVGGRWNSPGRPLIYAAETFAGALLEVLVHSNWDGYRERMR